MKHIIVLLSLFFAVSTSVSKAQLSESKFKEVFGKADGNVYDGNFSAALPLLEELYESDSTNAHVCYLLGVTYLNTFGKRPMAISMLEKAIGNVKLDHKDGDSKDRTAPGLAYYYLAKAYHLNYKFEDAITNYFNYRSFISMEDYTQYAEVKRQIESAENGKTLVEAPVKVRIENLGIGLNSKWDDFSPVVSADGSTLIFTSRRQGSTGGKLTREGKYYDDIYISQKEDGRWSAPKSIGSSINSEGHEATIGLSADGQQLLVYKDDNGDGNIYYSRLNGESWTALTKYGPTINAKSWETHASISSDGTVLYFTSNRSGGVGGRDIYYCKKLPTGEWSLPKNLGKVVNTPYDEEAPFVSADGNTLYFASRGHVSMGGFDIMFSTKVDTGWGEPQNIGYPINTPDDDVFFVTTADGNTAYYSSQKPDGIGGLDIYAINFEDKEAKTEPTIAIFKGSLKANDTKKVPASANIVVTSKSTNEVVGIFKPNSATGAFLISLNTNEIYSVSYEMDGYVQKKEEIDLKTDLGFREIEKDILLDPVGGMVVSAEAEKQINTKKSEAETEQIIVATSNEKPKDLSLNAEVNSTATEKPISSESQALLDRKRQLEEQIKLLRSGKSSEDVKQESSSQSAVNLEEERKKQVAAEEEAKRLAKAEFDALAAAAAAKKAAEEEKILAEKQAKAKAEEDAKAKIKLEAEAKAKAKAAAIEKARQEELAKQKAEQLAKSEADKLALAASSNGNEQLDPKSGSKEEDVASAVDKLRQKKEDEAFANSEYGRLKAQAEEAEVWAEKKAKELALAQKAAKSANQSVANAKVAAELKVKKEAEAKAVAAAKSKLMAAQKAKEAAELKAIETRKAQLEAENAIKRSKLGLKEGEDISLALAKIEEEMLAKQSEEKASLESLKEKEEAFKKAKFEAEEIQKQKAKAAAEKKALEDLRIKEEQRLRLEAEARQREEQQIALAAKLKAEQEARAAQIAEEKRLAQAKAEEERMKAAQAREEAKKAAREKLVADSIAKVQNQLALKAKQKADQERKEKEQYELKVQYESGEMQSTISTQKKRISDLENDNRLLRDEMKAMADQVAFLTKELEYQKSRFQEAQQRNDQIRSLILNEPTAQLSESDLANDNDFSKLRENKKVILKNIYFDYDKSFLKRESFPELNKLYNYLVMHPDLSIEIGGHTDSKGNDDYNLNLSKDRATAVMEHLTAKGINGKRLKAIGFGETQPIAPNENQNGIDNPEGRQQNRRIEIRVFK